MSYNPKSLFNKLQQKEQANASGSSQNFSNPLLFKPKVGASYAIRLLWLSPEEGYDREYPMINSYIHRVWDENATTGNKDNKVICPTSQYIMGDVTAAFQRCPICTTASDFYRKGQEGSASGKELYSKFRRTCVGYIPIYIVNGPEDEINQIRILQYGKQFKDFFDEKIFGIKQKSKKSDDSENYISEEAIGVEAFMYFDDEAGEIVTKGYNLIISTSTKKMNIDGKQVDMPQYSLDFTRKPSVISELDGIDLDSKQGIKYFNSLNSQVLHYDRDFYLKSTDEELHNFKLNFISKTTLIESTETEHEIPITSKPVLKRPVKSVTDEDEEIVDEIPMGNTNTKINIDKDIDEVLSTSKKPADDISDDDDAMIDDLLAGIQ